MKFPGATHLVVLCEEGTGDRSHSSAQGGLPPTGTEHEPPEVQAREPVDGQAGVRLSGFPSSANACMVERWARREHPAQLSISKGHAEDAGQGERGDLIAQLPLLEPGADRRHGQPKDSGVEELLCGGRFRDEPMVSGQSGLVCLPKAVPIVAQEAQTRSADHHADHGYLPEQRAGNRKRIRREVIRREVKNIGEPYAGKPHVRFDAGRTG